MSYEEYAKTDKEKLIFSLRNLGMAYSQISDKIGLSERNVYRTIARVKKRAADQGYAPEHGWTRTLPQGHVVSGVSTLQDADGSMKLQWIKSKSSVERQMELLLDRLETAHENYEPFEPIPPAEDHIPNLCSVLTITDFHLGMYAYEAETGDDWDMKIAERVFLTSVHDMIEASPSANVGILCQLGDFLHWDGILSASTPMSGHALDADTRYSKLVELAMTVMAEAVKMMLAKYAKVVLVSAEGNHDISGSIWLRKHIKHLFSKEPRLEVIDNDYPFYAYQHGKVMLAFHHGHKVKHGQLHKLFASDPRFRSMWGASDYTYIATGHYHHERVVEDGGAITEQHPTLSGRDAYAARGGFVSSRGAKVITYDAERGEVARITIRPAE